MEGRCRASRYILCKNLSLARCCVAWANKRTRNPLRVLAAASWRIYCVSTWQCMVNIVWATRLCSIYRPRHLLPVCYRTARTHLSVCLGKYSTQLRNQHSGKRTQRKKNPGRFSISPLTLPLTCRKTTMAFGRFMPSSAYTPSLIGFW